jgi:transposase-like protein
MRVMAAPRKYPDELRERATRMAVDARRDPATRSGALKRIGEESGINPETLRHWVTQADIDQGPLLEPLGRRQPHPLSAGAVLRVQPTTIGVPHASGIAQAAPTVSRAPNVRR